MHSERGRGYACLVRWAGLALCKETVKGRERLQQFECILQREGDERVHQFVNTTTSRQRGNQIVMIRWTGLALCKETVKGDMMLFSSSNALCKNDWYFIAGQPAPAPHRAHPEGCSVLVTVPHVRHSRSLREERLQHLHGLGTKHTEWLQERRGGRAVCQRRGVAYDVLPGQGSAARMRSAKTRDVPNSLSATFYVLAKQENVTPEIGD